MCYVNSMASAQVKINPAFDCVRFFKITLLQSYITKTDPSPSCTKLRTL